MYEAVEVKHIINLATGEGSQLHTPHALYQDKGLPISLDITEWAPELIWAWWQRQKSLSTPGTGHQL
jgi:hypothetical protein